MRDREFFAVGDQPGPAAAEHFRGRFTEFRLECRIAAKCSVDRLGEFAARLASLIFLQDFPEEGVIVLAASVVAHGGTDILRNFVQVQQQLLERHFLNRFRRLRECLIQVFDVGAIVFVVMNLHRLRVDVRFERVVGITEFG